MKSESFIHYPILSKFSELTHFCTTRFGGSSIGSYGTFNLSPFTGDNIENVRINQQILAQRLNINLTDLFFPFQTHGSEVKAIDKTFLSYSMDERKNYLHGVDALVTDIPKLCIAVSTADCVPILLFDSKLGVVAAIHAGWRGTCARIIEKTLDFMKQNYGTNVFDVVASIGASISSTAYNVGEELVREFDNQHFESDLIFSRSENGLCLDLWAANKWVLQSCGVPDDQIEIAGLCTYTESERFFSARKLGIQSGRMLSGILIN